MNVLFLTLLDFYSINERNIYTDLLREFIKDGHFVHIISPVEKRRKKKTQIIKEKNATILKLRIGNIQKTNLIEKGISTITLEKTFIKAIKQYFSTVSFDLVIYSTPPITFQESVDYIKKRDGAKTYLLLKDIFPQNSVDMGMLSTKGIKAPLYRYFRSKEKKLYAISDYIGCMSQANMDYVIQHNPEIDCDIIEVCPNSIEVFDKSISQSEREKIRKRIGIPLDKKVFVYGGNLGKPQGIDFLIKCIYSQRKNKNAFFIVIGDGTEYKKLEKFIKEYHQDNFKLMKHLPKEDYDNIVCACDVGLIFLDYRFTIPNFPSRLLNYMQARIPILACTDLNTDIGKVIEEGGFGWWCKSNSVKGFNKKVKEALKANKDIAGEYAYQYLLENYNVEMSYKAIIKHYH